METDPSMGDIELADDGLIIHVPMPHDFLPGSHGLFENQCGAYRAGANIRCGYPPEAHQNFGTAIQYPLKWKNERLMS